MKKESLASDVHKSSIVVNVFLNLIFVVFCIVCIYPMLLIIGTSFASEESLLQYGYRVFPKEFSSYAYTYILSNTSTILRAYWVTILSTLVGTAMSVLVNALYAYAVSRQEFKYRNFFTFYMFFTMLFGGGMVPWYLVCTRLLHLTDTFWALVLPSVCSAWNMIILRTFFASTVPNAVVESARIDGASEMRTLFSIVFPISLPGLATIGLFAMLGYWNNYYNALMLTNDVKWQNLQLYLYNILTNISMLQGSNSAVGNSDVLLKTMPKEAARMAMCVVTVGPIIFAYPFFQKYFVQGLTIGAVKG